MGELLAEHMESYSTDVLSLSKRLGWTFAATETLLTPGFAELPPRETLERLALALLTDYEVVPAAALTDLGYTSALVRLDGPVSCFGIEYHPHELESAPTRTTCVSRRLASEYGARLLRQHGVSSDVVLDVLHGALLTEGRAVLTPAGAALVITSLPVSSHVYEEREWPI